MAEGIVRFNVTVTEVPQYRVLVAFLCTVEELTATRDDDELQALVTDVYSDLLALSDGRPG